MQRFLLAVIYKKHMYPKIALVCVIYLNCNLSKIYTKNTQGIHMETYPGIEA